MTVRSKETGAARSRNERVEFKRRPRSCDRHADSACSVRALVRGREAANDRRPQREPLSRREMNLASPPGMLLARVFVRPIRLRATFAVHRLHGIVVSRGS